MSNIKPTRTGPLTDRILRTLEPGKHFDKGRVPGLYIEVTGTGARHWRRRYKFAGRQRVISLGAYCLAPVDGKAPQTGNEKLQYIIPPKYANGLCDRFWSIEAITRRFG